MIEPLRLSFVVRCDVAHAFEVFTTKASTWWPYRHSTSQVPGLTVTFEPRLGGRIFERSPDGAESEWGEIVLWEPPSRLGYLWHIRADRSQATDVHISFTAQGADSTCVEIVHGGWDRLDTHGPARRDGNNRGWEGLLPHYIAACAR